MSKPQSTDLNSTNSEASFEDTPPYQLTYEMGKSDAEKKAIQERIDTWSNQVKEDVSEVLKKHGINRHQLSYYHSGTKELFLSGSDNVYEATLLAKTTYVALRDQVAKKLNI